MNYLINVIMGVCDKLIIFFPTDKKKVEKYEYIKQHIDYEDGEMQKLYLEKRRKKVLFSMSTELVYNEKNVAVFESFMKHPNLEDHFNSRLGKYFELSDSKLCIINSKMAKIEQNVFFCYWKLIAILSSFFFICTPFLIFFCRNRVIFIVSFAFISFLFFILSLIMIGNKKQDLHSIKLYKENILSSSK